MSSREYLVTYVCPRCQASHRFSSPVTLLALGNTSCACGLAIDLSASCFQDQVAQSSAPFAEIRCSWCQVYFNEYVRNLQLIIGSMTYSAYHASCVVCHGQTIVVLPTTLAPGQPKIKEVRYPVVSDDVSDLLPDSVRTKDLEAQLADYISRISATDFPHTLTDFLTSAEAEQELGSNELADHRHEHRLIAQREGPLPLPCQSLLNRWLDALPVKKTQPMPWETGGN